MSGFTVEDCGFCRNDLNRKVRGVYRAGWPTTPSTVETHLYWCESHNRQAWDWMLDEGYSTRLTRLDSLGYDGSSHEFVWRSILVERESAQQSSGSPFPGSVTAGGTESPAVTPEAKQ